MKILRIIARLNVGGPARHVLWLTRELNYGPFESHLIAGAVPRGEEDMGYLAEDLGVKPIYIREMSRELSPRDTISFWKILREIRRIRPDIIHTHTAKAGTLGRVAAFVYKWFTAGTLVGRPKRVRVIHTFHGHVFHSYYGRFKTSFFLFIERLLARCATDKFVVISQQQFKEIHGKYGVGRVEQFEIIPLGIDLKALLPGPVEARNFRDDIGAEKDDIVVSFVGRLTEIKNLKMLLQAVAAIKDHADVKQGSVRLMIAGDGHLRSSLEEYAKESGVHDLVSFVGIIEEPADVYSASDIVALTSLNEGTPLSLIEAMAVGRPVIATAVGGVVDLLGEVQEECDRFSVCERGIAVASGDVSGFVNGLAYLIKNERLRKRLAESGNLFVVENYSKERLVRDIVSLYESLAV